MQTLTPAGRLLLLLTLTLSLLLAATARPVHAQETTATIVGTAMDQSGAVLPGVTVIVKNNRTGQSTEVVTNDQGLFTASLLPVGDYDVTFRLQGFQPYTVRNIALHVNDRVEVNGRLGVGTISENVEVSAASTFVQPTPAVQSLIGATQAQELPINNRNFVQLAALAPGVSSDLADEANFGLSSLASISVNGARRNAVNWLLDGASNVDVGSNITLLATPTLESIEEFKILTSSYAAEWPRSGGGVISVVTKSGSRRFSGSGYEFLRNDKFNSNSYFRKLSTDPQTRDNPPRLRYNNFGYTIGGPALPSRERMFFFFSEEWRRISRQPAARTANVPVPDWLTDPANPNYVPPADRDPNAVRLLTAYPAPNITGTQFVNIFPDINNTRQEVVRVDYEFSASQRLTGRYTHDLSDTREPGGLFFGISIPNIATTRTAVPGNVAVVKLASIFGSGTLNEASYQMSGNRISTTNPDGTRNTKAQYGLTTQELFPENAGDRIPTIRLSGLTNSTIGATQPINIEYRNHTFGDNFTFARGNHTYKAGALITFEAKDENAASATQGDFTFAAGGGFTAFQNFLRGNRDGACGTTCTYTEAANDITENLRFNRYEAFVQDTWRINGAMTLDYGVRYSLYPPVTDENNVLTSFSPAAYRAADAPPFVNASGSLISRTQGNILNGVYVADQTSPHGRAIYQTDKNNFQPRVGFSWAVPSAKQTIFRTGYGVYYDEPLIGIFEQNSFTNPPFNNNPQILNPSLSNPGAGVTSTTTGVRNLIGTSDPFETPRTQQWNVGIQRQLYARGVVDLSYVGSRGDRLIQPVDINQPQPADVVAVNPTNSSAAPSQNVVRPFLGYGSINMRQTTARSRYNGLLMNFRHEGGRTGFLSVSYTLSRNKATATNDRDAIDLPQNPLDLDAEYAVARTDRTHIFGGSYSYELPFLRNSQSQILKHVLGGWQIAGITSLASGPPVSRIVTNSRAGRVGIRANAVGDPFQNVPSVTSGAPYYINPAAFAPPPEGQYGDSGRAPFRLPGRHQWDISLSKNWLAGPRRVQFRADVVNLFNRTQFLTIDNVCSTAAATTTCDNPTFGKFDSARQPREVQFGVKVYW
jgi:carboxypeptidase family protein